MLFSSTVFPPQGVRFERNTIVSGKTYMIPVQVIDTPGENLTWTDNLIYGGTLKDVTLETTKEKPEIPDVTETLSAIRKNAGKRW